MTRTLLTRAIAGAILFAAAATTAGAQATREGTTITNNATASYTDANGNTYTNVNATVSVRVGLKAAIDAAMPAGPLAPVAGSTGNTVAVTITNAGNGKDWFSLAVTPPSGVTVTGYTFNGTTHATIAALNAALAATDTVDVGASQTVTLVYSVSSGTTGSGTFGVVATSVRGGVSVTDNASTPVNYTTQAVVVVSPNAASSSRLPSEAVTRTYTQVFTINNTGSAAGDFAITVQTSGVVENATLSAATATGLAAGGNTTVTVTYTVAAAAAINATGTIRVTATGTGATPATVTNQSSAHTVTVIRPALAFTKSVTLAGGAAIPASGVLPGQELTYTLTVTNNGTTDAVNVVMTDVLPAQLTYKAGTLAGTGVTTDDTTVGTMKGTVATLAPAASRSITFTVTVK